MSSFHAFREPKGAKNASFLNDNSNLRLSSFLCLEFFLPGPYKAKDIGCNLPHLDLLRTFRDPISSKMAIDVFEGVVAGVAIASMNLTRFMSVPRYCLQGGMSCG